MAIPLPPERNGILFPKPTISFDASRLPTGPEVIANPQLGKKPLHSR
jgi:hypothetical protein